MEEEDLCMVLAFAALEAPVWGCDTHTWPLLTSKEAYTGAKEP